MWLQSVLEAEQAVAASLEQVRSVLDTAPVHKGWLQAQLQDSCVTPQVMTHICIEYFTVVDIEYHCHLTLPHSVNLPLCPHAPARAGVFLKKKKEKCTPLGVMTGASVLRSSPRLCLFLLTYCMHVGSTAATVPNICPGCGHCADPGTAHQGNPPLWRQMF